MNSSQLYNFNNGIEKPVSVDAYYFYRKNQIFVIFGFVFIYIKAITTL